MLERYQRQATALGSSILLTIISSQKNSSTVNELLNSLMQYIYGFERQFSRFRSDSELTKFNNRAGREVTVSNEFRNVLVAAKEYSSITNGMYNPFILPALQRAGYVGSWPNPDEYDPVTNFDTGLIAPYMELTIDHSIARIPKGTAIDLGGICKGYVLDRLAELCDNQPGIYGLCFSIGGDIIYAGNDINSYGWKINLCNSIKPLRHINIIETKSKLIGVSTTDIDKYCGNNWHHIINSETGLPAKTNYTRASVCSNSATASDVFAKCLIIGGHKFAKSLISKGYIDSYILQRKHEPINA